MKTLDIWGIALALLTSMAIATDRCSSIEVRKEWRALSRTERGAWIDAVNCLNKAPRNGKLKPPVDIASYSNVNFQIAPLNEESTYYDDFVYAYVYKTCYIVKADLPASQPHEFESPDSLDWTFLAVAPSLPARVDQRLALRMRIQGYIAILGLGEGQVLASTTQVVHNIKTNTPDAANFKGSDIWDTNPEVGLGGFSNNPSDDYTLHTGALNITVAYPVRHRLRRHYTPYPYDGSGIPGPPDTLATSLFTPSEVKKLLATPTGNFTAFQGYLEKLQGMHAVIHLMIGGDMGTICPKGTLGTSDCPVDRTATFSTNDPVFHLHHGNVDRLWWLWQEKSSINKNAFHGGSVQNISSLDTYPNGEGPWLKKTARLPGAGLWKEYTIEETLDTREWPWCYVYE